MVGRLKVKPTGAIHQVFVRRLITAAAALSLLLCNGCLFFSNSSRTEAEKKTAQEREASARTFKAARAAGQKVSIQELDQLTYGYADRYYMVMSSAVDAVKSNNPDPGQRRLAHQLEVNGVLAMNDIVTENDPYARTLDLVVSVTLQSILLIDENGAEKAFGERAPGLIKAIRTMRAEAWELVAKVLNQDQLELLDYLILEWRRSHPEVDQVAFVKFDEFAGARAAGLMTDFQSGEGFLAPLSEANQVMKDWSRITERAFWYSKRAPNIAAMQAEGAVNEIMATPEIGTMLQTADRLGKTVEAAPQTIDEERKAFFAELDNRQTLLTNTLGDVRHIVDDANTLGATASLLATNLQQTLLVLGDTLKEADSIGRHFGLDQPSTSPPARPFDIHDYVAALDRLNEVVTNVYQLSSNVDQITRSAGWKRGLQDMTDATDRRVDRVFTRLCEAIGLAFILAVVYRYISLKMSRKLARADREKT